MSTSEPRVVIITGVSGSGKSTALRALEDAGYYCVDNLPIVFLEKLLELSGHTQGEVTRIALGVDAR
jgi:RNase adapter protein RapZ